MIITRYSATNLRSINFVNILPSKNINIVLGKNNDGKTSLLEGIYFASCLKSFKPVDSQLLIKHNQSALQVLLNVTKSNYNHVITIENRLNSVKIAKVDDTKTNIKSLMLMFPAIALSFGTENIVLQTSEHRRKLLDWGAFHVEPSYLDLHKSYLKTIKQRNSVLKQGNKDGLDVWTNKLGLLGDKIDIKRAEYFSVLNEQFSKYKDIIKSYDNSVYTDISNSTIKYSPGWNTTLPLTEVLMASMDKDLALKYTTRGPHRADITFTALENDLKNTSSMSTQIITSLLIILSQSEVFHVKHGFRPIILIDDLFFGIDDNNLRLVINLLVDSKTQCFITAPDLYTEKLMNMCANEQDIKIFKFNDKKAIEEING